MEMRVGSLSPGGCHLTGASEHEVAVHKALRHAASHPSTRDATDALVNKRRLEWRNSHRNYRSTPTSASREHTVTYEARRALRDHLTIESPPPSPAPSSSYSPSVGRSVILPSPLEHNDVDIGCVQRRALPRRGGSMREPISPKDEFSESHVPFTLRETIPIKKKMSNDVTDLKAVWGWAVRKRFAAV